MKKFIYPIVAILALVTVSAFTSHEFGTKCTGKEVRNSDGRLARHSGERHKVYEVTAASSQIRPVVENEDQKPLFFEIKRIEMFDSLVQGSDEQIDIQFNREEITIEMLNMADTDEMVNSQFIVDSQ
jgi:hypothetical protein